MSIDSDMTAEERADRDQLDEAIRRSVTARPESDREQMLAGWVVVSYWVDAEGDGTTVTLRGPGVSEPLKHGLLFTSLHLAGDDDAG